MLVDWNLEHLILVETRICQSEGGGAYILERFWPAGGDEFYGYINEPASCHMG